MQLFAVSEQFAERAAADAEVSRAAYALADTGSVVLLSSDEPRSRSLLPWRHVTIVREDTASLSCTHAQRPSQPPSTGRTTPET